MAQRIPNQEIFAIGKWNGDQYSIGDLDSMVSAFHSLKFPVPLKLGHTEGSKWFGQEDGHPALGWVEHVRRVGEKLVADFANVPDMLVEMIKNRSYRTKSAEIYWNFTSPDGQEWPRTLKAVSLLGADLPAVTTLNDLHTTLMSDNTYSISKQTGTWSTSSDGTFTLPDARVWKEYLWESNKEPDMDKDQEKKFKQDIDELESALKSQKKKYEELEDRANEAEARAVKAEAELAGLGEKHAIEQFTSEVESLIKEGKVLPKEKDGLIRQFVALGSGKKKYGEVEFTPRQELTESLKSRDKRIDFKENGTGGDTHQEDDPPAVAVNKQAHKYMRDEKLSYTDAICKVKEEFPDLWTAYMNPGKGGDS